MLKNLKKISKSDYLIFEQIGKVEIMLRSIAFCFILLSSTYAHSADIDDLERLVGKMPRGTLDIPIYWFEMRTSVGWEKMMLVLGYADNRSICDYLKSIAYKSDPQREFRYSAAN